MKTGSHSRWHGPQKVSLCYTKLVRERCLQCLYFLSKCTLCRLQYMHFAVDVSKLIGKSIALYNPTQKRFVRMPTGVNMDKSPERPDGTLPDNWTWEVFKVVDGGNGMIALYNTLHKRFVRMPTGNNMDKSAERPDGTLPKDWPWEVFKVMDAGDGMIALYNPTHKRFARMPTATLMDKSAVTDGTLPKDWTWEVFKIVDAKPSPHGLFVCKCLGSSHCKPAAVRRNRP